MYTYVHCTVTVYGLTIVLTYIYISYIYVFHVFHHLKGEVDCRLDSADLPEKSVQKAQIRYAMSEAPEIF